MTVLWKTEGDLADDARADEQAEEMYQAYVREQARRGLTTSEGAGEVTTSEGAGEVTTSEGADEVTTSEGAGEVTTEIETRKACVEIYIDLGRPTLAEWSNTINAAIDYAIGKGAPPAARMVITQDERFSRGAHIENAVHGTPAPRPHTARVTWMEGQS